MNIDTLLFKLSLNYPQKLIINNKKIVQAA